MAYISIDTAYWAMSTMSGVLGTFIGLLFVGFFYYIEKTEDEIKMAIKDMPKVKGIDQLPSALNNIFIKLSRIILKEIIIRNSIQMTLIPLFGSLFLCLIGIFLSSVEYYIIYAFIHSLITLGNTYYQVYKLTVGYDEQSKKLEKKMGWKKLLKKAKIRYELEDMDTGKKMFITSKEKKGVKNR